MKRTISIKIKVAAEDSQELFKLGHHFVSACNEIVPFAMEYRCWNRVALHHLCYSKIRMESPLGSQMVCNAIFAVCKAYKNRGIEKSEEVPKIQFRKNASVHFDKRTYSIKGKILSLYTLGKRIKVEMRMSDFQEQYFAQGIPKEAELICKKEKWFFNLVLDLPDPALSQSDTLLGVDLGENNAAAMSSGKLICGGKIRFQRDQYLAMRRRLQSNGSQSAKQLLKKISGKEALWMKHVNHGMSNEIVKEALQMGAGMIVLEDLKNMRKRIKGSKRNRTRLHRWAFSQLQLFVEYKAQARGLGIIYMNPAYSSQICSLCGALGARQKHRFTCSCGNRQHSDLNASRNLCRFALSADRATCAVNRTHVAVNR